MGATAAAAAVGPSVASAASDDTYIDDDVHPTFSSSYVSNPWANASITVNDHKGDMADLEFINDSDAVESLTDHGYVLARDPDNEDTPHNPVTLKASDIQSAEYSAFPRGATYDDDADTSTDEVPVEWHDPTHWTLTNATNGSISLAEEGNDAMRVSSSAVASGEVVKATFDLSTVASSDATITDGMSRLFIQNVVDVDALPSGVVVEVALIDSNAAEVSTTYDPAGDASTAGVLASATGASQVVNARVGDLEDAQAVTLADIQKVELRIKETDADLLFYGFNLERATEWTFGTEEYQTTDSDGSTIVDTRDVTTPSGTFGVVDLASMDGGPFGSAPIDQVKYDAECRMSELDVNRVHSRVEDTPDTYDYPKRLEYVAEYEAPVAYSLKITHSNVEDIVALPSSRYEGVEVATSAQEIDEWADVEDAISWTDKTGSYGSVDKRIELLSTHSASNRLTVRIRTLHKSDEIEAATQSPSGGGAAVAVDGGGGGFDWSLTAIFGLVAAGGLWFRKSIMGALSG